MNIYEAGSLTEKLSANSYPGRGIVLGQTADGKTSVAAYFIMGRSSNSRNRVFVEDGEGTVRKRLIPRSWRIPA